MNNLLLLLLLRLLHQRLLMLNQLRWLCLLNHMTARGRGRRYDRAGLSVERGHVLRLGAGNDDVFVLNLSADRCNCFERLLLKC